MTLKCASDSVDNTHIHCIHLVLLYEKLAVQCPIENIRTGREIQEVVTVRFVPNKRLTRRLAARVNWPGVDWPPRCIMFYIYMFILYIFYIYFIYI